MGGMPNIGQKRRKKNRSSDKWPKICGTGNVEHKHDSFNSQGTINTVYTPDSIDGGIGKRQTRSL